MSGKGLSFRTESTHNQFHFPKFFKETILRITMSNYNNNKIKKETSNMEALTNKERFITTVYCEKY